MLRNVAFDEGPPGWIARHCDLTRQDEGTLDPNLLVGLLGANSEHLLFQRSPYGRMSPADFSWLVSDLKSHGMTVPVLVIVDLDAQGKQQVMVYEGNHRLRAALIAGVEALVEIRYFMNSQRLGVMFEHLFS